MKEKISTGSNDRPKNKTIGQSGSGLQDDSGSIIEVNNDEIKALGAKLGVTEASEARSPVRQKDQD